MKYKIDVQLKYTTIAKKKKKRDMMVTVPKVLQVLEVVEVLTYTGS